MPVTPFHLGVGLLGKGIAPSRVSLSAFVVSQVIIDLESAYYLFVVREWPVHRWMHTFAVASIIGVIAGAATWATAAGVRRLVEVPFLAGDWGLGACLLGGLVGGVTHPLLDGIMHADIQPFRPLAEGNPLLGLLGLGALHLLCVFAAIAGLALLALRAVVSARKPGRAIK